MSNITDETGNGHTGTTVGSPEFVPAAIGLGWKGNGVDRHINVANPNNELDLQAFTYMCWFKTAAVGSGGLQGCWTPSSNSGTLFYISSAGFLNGLGSDGAGNVTGTNRFHVISPEVVDDGKMRHGALTWDGSVAKLFIGAQEVASYEGWSGLIDYVGVSHIQGAWLNSSDVLGNWLNGWMDDPRVYRRALSGEEIFDIIKTTIFSFETSVLNALPDWYWQLDESNGIVAVERRRGINNLEYESDAGTLEYSIPASQFDGRGFAKQFIGNDVGTPQTYKHRWDFETSNWSKDINGTNAIQGSGGGWGSSSNPSPLGGLYWYGDGTSDLGINVLNASAANRVTWCQPANPNFAMWLYSDATLPTAGTGDKTAFAMTYYYTQGFKLALDEVTGYLEFSIWIDDVRYQVSSLAAFNDSAWKHVVCTHDGQEIKLYINNVLQGTTAAVGDVDGYQVANTFQQMWIGSKNLEGFTDDHATYRWSGGIDGLILYFVPLTAEDVDGMYLEDTGVPQVPSTTLQIYDPVQTQFHADWVDNVFEDPLGFMYNTLEGQGTADPEVVYSRYETVGDYGEATWGNKWRTIGWVGNNSGDLRRDATHVASRVVRRASQDGKFVYRWDYINDGGFTNGLALAVAMGYSDQMYLGNQTQDSGTAITIRGSGDIYKQNTLADDIGGTVGNGNHILVFVDFDNMELHVSKNGGAILSTVTLTLGGWYSLHCGRSGDRTTQVALDTMPDISGAVLPSGVASDWKGWNDRADFESRQSISYIPNDISSWMNVGSGVVSNVTTASGTSLVVTGGTGATCTARSIDIVAPATGEYILIVELDDTEIFNRTDERKYIFGYLNGVQQTFDSAVDVGAADAYDSSYDCGIMTTRFSATAGDTLSVGVGRQYDNISSFRNARIVGVI